jgi:transcriptional regulator of acetoin/glycerol metabolism
MIENRLMACDGQRHIRLHLHARPEGIGTVAEGIALISADGWLVGANRAALALLRLSRGQLGSVSLEQVLDAGPGGAAVTPAPPARCGPAAAAP